jgi:hypothetical protein
VEYAKSVGEVMSESKLKAGNVLRYVPEDGSIEEYMCWATVNRHGTTSAWIQRFGLARQLVTEEHELVKQSELVSGDTAALLSKIKELESAVEELQKSASKKTTVKKKTPVSKKATQAKDGE